jgi:hypothetical protein
VVGSRRSQSCLLVNLTSLGASSKMFLGASSKMLSKGRWSNLERTEREKKKGKKEICLVVCLFVEESVTPYHDSPILIFLFSCLSRTLFSFLFSNAYLPVCAAVVDVGGGGHPGGVVLLESVADNTPITTSKRKMRKPVRKRPADFLFCLCGKPVIVSITSERSASWHVTCVHSIGIITSAALPLINPRHASFSSFALT